MKYLVNVSQMKAIDEYAIERAGILSLILMERAAMAVADVVKAQAKPADRILAVCGMGNNGGDGVAAARILYEAGLDVSVLLLGEAENASPQLKKQLEIGHFLDLPVFNYKNSNIIWEEYNILIDGIFGIGLGRPIEGIYQDAVATMNQARERGSRLFAIDIPSGIHGDTGKVMNVAVKADYTITFGYNKLGMVLYPGTEYAGEVIVADIGFPRKALSEVRPECFTYDMEELKRLPVRKAYSNKGNYGKVLVIGGAKNMSGAAYFAGKAAYLSGAGLVKIFTTEENRQIYQSQFPEGLLSTYRNGCQEEMLCKGVEEEINWATVIIIGPGLGTAKEGEVMLKTVLDKAQVPVVIDADALNLLGKNGGLAKIQDCNNLVITPHLKEMSRLCNWEVSDISSNMIHFSKEIMKDKNFTCVLKDARTVVTNGRDIYLNQTGNSGMAVGGSGDVLSGIIGGLLAQGMELMEGAALGVYLHGAAGDQAARERGKYSLLPSDILEGLVCVLKHTGIASFDLML